MKVLLASAEVAPFAKTGGLADVAGSLPKALHQLGCDVRVFMPKYDTIDESISEPHYENSIGEIPVRVGGLPRPVHVQRSTLPHSTVPIYMIDCPHFFHRGAVYTNHGDEDERFILFSKAIIEVLQRMRWAPDIIHCNDWPTALIPLFLRENYSWDRFFDDTATLMSIHNIGYQGLFPPSTIGRAEIPPSLFHPGGPVEFNGAVCFLKAGIFFAEMIGTVSDTYAREILTPLYGAGMQDILRTRQDSVHGILNGIDDDIWNPQTDHHLPFTFSAHDLRGKLENKRFLLKQTGMTFDEATPLIGIVSRLVAQKGLDVVGDALKDLMAMKAQWVILGSGEDRYEEMFTTLHHTLPEQVWTYVGFNTELAHLIEAGADMFLMPSHYEPCGLNQMYSLRYGTVPIVRKTGGLADTVLDWHECAAQGYDFGNGFSFSDPTGYAVSTTVERAVELFHNKPIWHKIQLNGMHREFSWKASARKYLAVYEKAVAARRGVH